MEQNPLPVLRSFVNRCDEARISSVNSSVWPFEMLNIR